MKRLTGTVNDRRAVEAAQTISDYCHQQRGCQNCIFRLHGAEHWKCHIKAFDLREVLSNINAKKKNGGWI